MTLNLIGEDMAALALNESDCSQYMSELEVAVQDKFVGKKVMAPPEAWCAEAQKLGADLSYFELLTWRKVRLHSLTHNGVIDGTWEIHADKPLEVVMNLPGECEG